MSTILASFKASEYYDAPGTVHGLQHLELTIGKRMEKDRELEREVQKVGQDAGDLERDSEGRIVLPTIFQHTTASAGTLEWLYEGALDELKMNKFDQRKRESLEAAVTMSARAYICSVNAQCKITNDEVMSSFAGEEQIAHSENFVICGGEKYGVGMFSSDDFLESILRFLTNSPTGKTGQNQGIHNGTMPPGCLRLKPGAAVFIMVNLSALVITAK